MDLEYDRSAYMSKEAFCRYCHIGKATALRLISSGLVPAIDTKKQTCRYLILRQDAESFLRDLERNPAKYGAKRTKNIQTYGVFDQYQRKTASSLKHILHTDWNHLPDLLRVWEVSGLLGYRSETIYRWRKKGWIQSLTVTGKLYIPKKSLIEFVAGPQFCQVQPKSQKHIQLIRRARHV